MQKLQISLPDFRRLCIFKGIYPREPRSKKKAKKGSTPSTTFYYTKDIQYLLHEPLLQKFREHKALAKKIGRALGRNEVGDAKRLERSKPRMSLDHIIKERYPTFIDALRDLDDALSMLFLFASLPSTTYVSPKTIALCQRLCHEFQHYLIVTHSLRKSFLSIKGIYYQATIQGQDILWLVPYKFVQRMSGDIDFRIMATFIDFYTTLLGFVNYRLYTSIGLVYPPKFNQESDEQGAELAAFTLEGKKVDSASPQAALTNGDDQHPEPQAPRPISTLAQAEADRLALATAASPSDAPPDNPSEPQAESPDALDAFAPLPSLGGDMLAQPQFLSNEPCALFADFTFFLSRETPRAPLELLLKAFGCRRVGWDRTLGEGGFTADEGDARVTHQVVDRPGLLAGGGVAAGAEVQGCEDNTRVPGRVYVQPQWVWDCVNRGRLVRTDLYAPGATLPPHLSPWVKLKRGVYDPTKSVEEQEGEGEAEDEEAEAGAGADEDGEMQQRRSGVAEELLDRDDDGDFGEGMDVAGSEDEDEDEDEEEDDERENDAFEGFSDADPEVDDETMEQNNYQAELEAEALGLPPPVSQPSGGKSEARRRAEKRKRDEEEELERREGMLTNKKKKLYRKMKYSNNLVEEEARKLRAKRRKLDREGVR